MDKGVEISTKLTRYGHYSKVSKKTVLGVEYVHRIIDEDDNVYIIDIDTLGRHVMLFDDFGQPIFSNDMVEVHNKLETSIPYVSRVEFGADGATVEPHPTHVMLGIGNREKLSRFALYGNAEFLCEDVSCKIIDNFR